jgi:hypothetical protein
VWAVDSLSFTFTPPGHGHAHAEKLGGGFKIGDEKLVFEGMKSRSKRSIQS